MPSVTQSMYQRIVERLTGNYRRKYFWPRLLSIFIYKKGKNKLVRFYGTLNVSDYIALNTGMIRNVFIKALLGAFQEGL